MIKDIKPFIDLGWYTVPLSGELKRLSNGTKTLPGFCKDWNNKYTKTRNEKNSLLGGVLTGSISDIVAIDCDSSLAFDTFRALDPNYAFVFVSKGKKDSNGAEIRTGTIIYKYSEDLPTTYRYKQDDILVDYYSSGGFVYLPTKANDTKEPFTITEVKEAPKSVVSLLKALKPRKLDVSEASLNEKTWRNHLGPQINNFIRAKKVVPNLFKVITPKDFRDLPEYKEKLYLSPSEVPEGRGSEYLSKVSAILGADESICVDNYAKAIDTINELFLEPMPVQRLYATIIEPMAEGRAAIDGDPIWRYNEDWQEGKLQLVTKRNEILDIFYDPKRLLYYAVDLLGGTTKRFDRDSDFLSFADTVAIDSLSKKDMKAAIPLVDAISTPAKAFGFFVADDHTKFNNFYPTKHLTIFKNPELYREKYREPKTILQFLRSLIPDDYMRNYLLKFLRRKFDFFEYSPVVLYFIGVPGAGKDTLVHIIEKIIGVDYLARPTTKEFLEKYNAWILDKYFVQLDEYGDQLTRFEDKANALGKIKAYTGKEQIQIRKMRTDGFNTTHCATFIATANKNPLPIEGDDRRLALFNCPTTLKNEPWVIEAGGVRQVRDKIDQEISDFAYYLSVKVENLSADKYQTPPDSLEKRKLIAAKFNASKRIGYYLENKMFDEFISLCHEHDTPHILNTIGSGRVNEEDLFDLYLEMTEGNGNKRGMNLGMQAFTKTPTTTKGKKAYYYKIPGLAGYSSNIINQKVIDDEL
jgi:hypothetical protein